METAFPRPIAWRAATLSSFLRYFSNESAVASTIIICCSKTAFLEALRAPLSSSVQHTALHSHEASANVQSHDLGTENVFAAFARPTLQLLSTAKSIRLVFCLDITHLRAYLATYSAILASRSDPLSESGDTRHAPILAILNLIQLHRPTSAFSAQGLNRTLANAVEAALQTVSQLVLVECPLTVDAEDTPGASQSEAEVGGEIASSNLWDEQVSILNVTTKSFGVGNLGWKGRSVSLRSIVGRWCRLVDRPPMHWS